MHNLKQKCIRENESKHKPPCCKKTAKQSYLDSSFCATITMHKLITTHRRNVMNRTVPQYIPENMPGSSPWILLHGYGNQDPGCFNETANNMAYYLLSEGEKDVRVLNGISFSTRYDNDDVHFDTWYNIYKQKHGLSKENVF